MRFNIKHLSLFFSSLETEILDHQFLFIFGSDNIHNEAKLQFTKLKHAFENKIKGILVKY